MISKVERAIRATLPDEVVSDIKANFKSLVNSNFEKMNLITLERLETQEKIIDRNLEKVSMLEKKLAKLESLIKN